MKAKLKNALTLLLVLCFATIFAPMALAADTETSGTCGDNVTWSLDTETGVLTISGTGDMEDCKGFSGEASMLWNDAPWYSLQDSITAVVIEDGVTSIGNYAFFKCSSLKSATIPDSVTTIGDCAFLNCGSLTSATIGNSVTSIGCSAFKGCSSLTGVTIPDSVTYIDDGAFEGCSSLTSVMIPDSVTYIGAVAFCECNSLTEIQVSAGNTAYSTEDGVLFNGDKTTLICFPEGKGTSYETPDFVTSIGDSAFYYCSNLTSVSISDSVTSIGDSAFCHCSNLISVTIPESVTSIGESAFFWCSSLASVAIPDSVTSISDYAFSECISLKNVTIGNSVTSIGEYAFSGCDGLTNVTIGNSVTSIRMYAFSGCSGLTSLNIPDSVTSIGYGAFSNCSGLTNVTIPDSVKSINEKAFAECSGLTSVVIPDSITSIKNYVFSKCTSLTSVTIPDSVTNIGYYAFYECSSLASITIPNSVTAIKGGAFWGCSSLTNVILPDSVTALGWYAFASCSNLKSVTIGNSITSIEKYAFSKCTSLTDAYYSGSEDAWNAIEIGEENECLTSATIHYNSTSSDTSGDDADSGTASSVQSYIDFAISFNGCSYSYFKELGTKFTAGSWCAEFITWCAGECGLSDVIPYTSGTGTLFQTLTNPNGAYKASGVYFGSSSASCLQYAERMKREDYVPQAGDLIFIVWNNRPATLGHVGLVIDYNADTEFVSFVDGNTSQGIVKVRDGVSYDNYQRTDSQIVGYVRPNYNITASSGTVTYSFHCPINVTVSYHGETLSSAEGILSASFGTMTIDDDGVTVVLDYGLAYDITVSGTDTGTMDVTVDYDLDTGSSSVNFTNVAITADTSVNVVSNIDNTTLIVSEAGELTEAWTASDGETATEADTETLETLLEEANSVEPDETEYDNGGTFGEDMSWTLDTDTGVLTISGTDMIEYESIDEPPWYSLEDYITEIVIEDGVTGISAYAFYYCPNVASVTVPASVTSIGNSAFYGCTSLTDVYYGGSEDDWNVIEIDDYNEYLTSAVIHYNSTVDDVSAALPTVTVSARAGSGRITAIFGADGNGCDVTGYTIVLKLGDTELETRTAASAGSVTFTGLTSGTEYTVEVTATTAAGSATATATATPKSGGKSSIEQIIASTATDGDYDSDLDYNDDGKNDLLDILSILYDEEETSEASESEEAEETAEALA